MTSVKCPGCGEASTGEMAFCIYCGTPFNGSAGAKPSASAFRGRPCASCGQADVLNSQFCIFCGASVDGTLTQSGHKKAVSAGAESGVGPSIREPGRPSTANMGIAAVIGAGIVGAALGFAMSWMGAQNTPVKASLLLPEQGIAILTTQANSAVQLNSHDKPTFIAGRTGSNGDVSMPNVHPGQYHLTITAPDGQTIQKDVTVPDDEPLIIGGPPDGEIFAKPQ